LCILRKKMRLSATLPALLLLTAETLAQQQQQQQPATRKRRGYWGQWIPDTAAWRTRLQYRAEQVKRIKQSQERWDAMMNLAFTGVLVHNFTEKGYAVVPTPSHLHKALNDSLWGAIAAGNARSEGKVDQIAGPIPQFVSVGAAKAQTQRDMQPLMEQWAGTSLQPTTAYGLRVYQPGNTLTMHTDRIETHVISCIVHVDRRVDEPWPIVIEGFDGRSVEVDLQPGQTLFYESAKCVHGRPRPLKGQWYTSLFVHYKPVEWDVKTNDAKRIVDPHWHSFKAPPSDKFATLRLNGTGYWEPDCPFNWCHLSPAWPPPPVQHPLAVSMQVAPDVAGILPGDEL